MRKVVVRPHIIGFKQSKRESAPKGKIHPAAQDCPDAVAGVHERHGEPVVSQHGVRKKHDAFVPPGKTRADGSGVFRSILVRVAPVVGFQAPVRGEVVSNTGAGALRDITQLLGHRSSRRLERRGYGAAWVQPLITHEEVYFGSFFLCHCGR